MTHPERAILADREALAAAERQVEAAEHPHVKAAAEADVRYLRGLIDRYEKQFFICHGIEGLG